MDCCCIVAEHLDDRGKAATLKKVIQLVLSGERFPGLLMTIIRFVLPRNDHQIKKLLLIFWEIWPKTSGDGKLLHEMILVCDAYRKVTKLLMYGDPLPNLMNFRICNTPMSLFVALH